jgi:hypothetical protein
VCDSDTAKQHCTDLSDVEERMNCLQQQASQEHNMDDVYWKEQLNSGLDLGE